MDQSTTESSSPSPTFPCFLADKREELTEILRSRLIECGWRDQVANMCRNLIQQHGVEQIRLEQIINEVRPKARQNVPDQVRAEILEMIRKFDQNQLQPTVENKLNETQSQQHKQQPPTLMEQEEEQDSTTETKDNNISLL